ncbi:putative reverse transcriptase domain-containing protein [Tanacetum coccineum]
MAPKRTTRSNTAPETTNTTYVTNAQLQTMIDQGVTVALAAPDANRSTNGDDSHNSGTGVRRIERTARECIYTDFLQCQPLNFKGTEGVAVALTWWNTHVKTVGHDAAYGMPWKKLMKMMTDKYCPRNEIKKLEMEIRDLKVKESDKIEKDVDGLPDMIHGSVVASKPKTMQDAVEISIELMDKKIHTFAERQTESKRKFEDTSRNTQNQQKQQQRQQQQNKRQNTGGAYIAGSSKKKPYGGSKPLCAKCNYHHDVPCAPKCHKCNKVGHFSHDCRSTANANNANNQKGTGSGQKPTCYECGVQGHFKRESPKMKNNNNRGNQVGGGNAPAKVLRYNWYGIGCKCLPRNRYVCGEKIVVSLGGNDILIRSPGDEARGNVASSATLISYNKNTRIHVKGCPVFLANVTTKETEDKSEKKRLEDVPIVRDFSDVFLEDLLVLPSTRQVEFQIDLIPGVAPFLTMGSSSLVFQKEGWIVSNVHRLSGTEQADSEESLSPASGTRGGYSENGVQNSVWSLRVPSYAIWLDERTSGSSWELLKKEKLYAKFSKCEFWIPKVQFLGHVIDSQGIYMDPAKIESIKEWESPKTPMKISQFLGLVGYYRRFVEGFSKITKSMTKLTQKGVKFN